MGKYKIEIFLLVIMPFIFLFSPMAHVRYYYESFTGDGLEFFSNFAIYAENKNGDYEIFDTDHENDVINISSRYRRGSFYFSGELINGIKGATCSTVKSCCSLKTEGTDNTKGGTKE